MKTKVKQVASLFACNNCMDTGEVERPGAYGPVKEPCAACDPDRNGIGQFRTRAPRNSRVAAINVYPRTGTQRRRVLDAIVDGHGLTEEELRSRTGLSGDSIRPRLTELRKMGWVQDSGRTRLTAAGNHATVWEPTQKARTA